MDRDKIAAAVHQILEAIGEDPGREGLQNTPQRVAEMYAEIFAGIGTAPQIKSGFSASLGRGDVIEIRNIGFHSICEHHLLPFFGTVDILYVPGDNRVAGFSAFASLVDGFARRPQIQERLTAQVADTIMEEMRPSAVLVLVRARQLCASMRGEHPRDIETVTEAIRGKLDPLRAAAFRQNAPAGAL